MVKNLTFGAPVLKSLRKHTDAFLDCHLMVTNPGQWVEVRSHALVAVRAECVWYCSSQNQPHVVTIDAGVCGHSRHVHVPPGSCGAASIK